MATAAPRHDPAPPPPPDASAPVKQTPGPNAWPQEPEDVPADRIALIFWALAFAILAFMVLCDLVLSFFR